VGSARRRGREVAQIMYTHVSNCKNKIKIKTQTIKPYQSNSKNIKNK
jgi:hypothetical protein